eukprot:TRINITY_DN1181_c0_g1_i1.p1 TRINITY_DN1181_c0_g1~~TRINITY_DN1181_c0_g1_i1.p1  ORF type:complete len:198 (+),score=53.93 TRINITY_DN1181_c0_g1_i1:101-694(+)
MAQDKPFKLILLGDIEVGKTSLIVRFVDGSFEDGKVQNFDTKEKAITVDGKVSQLEITDTAGQERFRTLTSSYYRNANAIIVVYDITNEESFKDVDGFLKEGQRYASSKCELFLVGNKTDLEDKRVVSTDAGQETAKRYSIPFFETSAKTGSDVMTLFESIAKKLVGTRPAAPGNGVIDVITPTSNKKQKKAPCTVL